MTYSKYPMQIDSNIELPLTVDNSTFVRAEVVNRFREAIFNIENELGVKPSSVFGTIRARLDYLEAYVVSSGGGGGPTTPVSQTGAGTISAFGVTVNTVLQSDGVTSGGIWRSYLALGGVPSATGTIRLSYGNSIYGKSSAGIDSRIAELSAFGILTIGQDTDTITNIRSFDSINIDVDGSAALKLTSSNAKFSVSDVYFSKNAGNSSFYQETDTTIGGARYNLTIQAQDSAVIGSTGGHLFLKTGLGLLTTGEMFLQCGSYTYLQLGSGSAYFYINYVTFNETLLTPTIRQNLSSVVAATGATLTLHAQDCTGGGGTIGGDLHIRPGLGDGYGELQLQDAYGTSRLKITSTSLIKAGSAIQLQGTNVSTTADIRAANNTTIIAARNSTNTGDIRVLATDNSNEVIVGHVGSICVLTGSQFYLQAGGVNQFEVITDYNISIAPNFAFEYNTALATILQRDDPTIAGSGRTLLMHAQYMTGGGGTTGGILALRGGHGDTHSPVVMYDADGSTVRGCFGGPAGGLGASPGDVCINGATYTYIYVGGLIVAYGYAGQFSYNVPALGFASGVISPYIQQDTNSTNNATAYTFTVGAQGVSGAVGTATAGDLCLRAGLATGSVTNKNGNVAVHSVPATWHSMEKGLFIANCVTVPDGYASGGSYLWAASAGLYTNSSFTFQGAANFQGALTQSYITKTHADTPYTIASNVSVILCDTVGGILTVTLPAVASSSGRRITILDWTGHATASPITIAVTDSTINGFSTIVINTNYGGSEVYCDGSVWRSLQASV